MNWRVLADLVVALHFAFIVFVAAGGFLTWRWPRAAWLHGIALTWGLWILATGALCPLTPLETAWRVRAGGLGYTGGFIERYITPVIYPAGDDSSKFVVFFHVEKTRPLVGDFPHPEPDV